MYNKHADGKRKNTALTNRLVYILSKVPKTFKMINQYNSLLITIAVSHRGKMFLNKKIA